MKDNTKYKKELLERLLRFAVRIIKLANRLPRTPAGYAVANQIVKSGTSIGANCEEAQEALSRKDFLKTINISLKEARETRYWLKVIRESELLPTSMVNPELQECVEIIAILTSSVKTLKRNK